MDRRRCADWWPAAEEWAIDRPLLAGLKIVQELFGIALANDLSARFDRDPGLRRLFQIGMRHLRNAGNECILRPSTHDWHASRWLMHRSSAYHREQIRMILLNPYDWCRLDLPNHLVWLFPAIYPWIWLRRRMGGR